MKLSENFELHELIKSQIAERKDISNNPSTDQINNLKGEEAIAVIAGAITVTIASGASIPAAISLMAILGVFGKDTYNTISKYNTSKYEVLIINDGKYVGKKAVDIYLPEEPSSKLPVQPQVTQTNQYPNSINNNSR
jgi:hypothetical protein